MCSKRLPEKEQSRQAGLLNRLLARMQCNLKKTRLVTAMDSVRPSHSLSSTSTLKEHLHSPAQELGCNSSKHARNIPWSYSRHSRKRSLLTCKSFHKASFYNSSHVLSARFRDAPDSPSCGSQTILRRSTSTTHLLFRDMGHDPVKRYTLVWSPCCLFAQLITSRKAKGISRRTHFRAV